MDEKKVREAIEYLSGYIQSNINLMEKIEGIVWIGEEPCKTAIEALQKQLPKKVDVWANGTEHCPVCDKNITYTGLHVCPECCQRLD